MEEPDHRQFHAAWRVAGVLVAAALFAGCWFAFRTHRGNDSEVRDSTSKQPRASAEDKAVPRGLQLDDLRRIGPIDRIVRSRAALESNVPIRFWGIVLDQEENPIDDVRVTMGVRQWMATALGSFGSASLKHTTLTDKRGRFDLLNESGDVLELERVEKSRYMLSPETLRSFSFHGPVPQRPDQLKPIVLRMWRLTNSEPTLVRHKRFRIVADGRPYTIDIIGNEQHEGEDNRGQILLSLARPDKVAPRERFPWTMELRAVGGGLIETQDEFLFMAPDTNYMQHLTILMDPANSNWTSVLAKKFYFKSGEGIYGAIRMKAYADYASTNAAVRLESVLNTNNSKNLQRQ